jgi:hypothetical protein
LEIFCRYDRIFEYWKSVEVWRLARMISISSFALYFRSSDDSLDENADDKNWVNHQSNWLTSSRVETTKMGRKTLSLDLLRFWTFQAIEVEEFCESFESIPIIGARKVRPKWEKQEENPSNKQPMKRNLWDDS